VPVGSGGSWSATVTVPPGTPAGRLTIWYVCYPTAGASGEGVLGNPSAGRFTVTG
jgi:hypothetical protein